jgi:hypothetical protein
MCQLQFSGVGYVPTPNVHSDVWDRVESYTMYMLLACRPKITFTFSLKLIISFLVQLQYLLLPSLIDTSSQVRVGTPLPLQLCCISGLGPGLLHHDAIVSSDISGCHRPIILCTVQGVFLARLTKVRRYTCNKARPLNQV